MNRYKSSIPRAALGFFAVTLTAITMGLSVIVPAKMGPGHQEGPSLAATKAVSPLSTEAALGVTKIDVVAVREPAGVTQIDVVAVREPALGTMQVRHLQPVPPKRKQQS